MGDYKYRVTGPKGGKYLTTTRKEAEKLTKNGGKFIALGQRKASKVRNPKGDRVYVTAPHWGKPFYGTVLDTMVDDGVKKYLIQRSPTSGATWYTADEFRYTGGKAKQSKIYASFTEGRQRYYAVAPDMGTAHSWVELWESHPSKSRLSISASKPRNAREVPMHGYRGPQKPRLGALMISKTAEQTGYGSDMHKRVRGLTEVERKHVRTGGVVAFEAARLSGGSHGSYWRIVIEGRNRDFYPRVPDDATLKKIRRTVASARRMAAPLKPLGNPGVKVLWGGGGQGFIKGEIPSSTDLFTIEKANISAPWVLRFFEDGHTPGRVLDYGHDANKLKKMAQRYVHTVADYTTPGKYKQSNPSFRDPFIQQYLGTALWSSWSSRDDEGEPLDANYTIYDFSPGAYREAVKDCDAFQVENEALLEAAYEATGNDAERAGHDFWLTRAGHGAGFWDGDWGEYGDALTAAAEKYRPVDLYVGDDGKLYFDFG